MPWAIIENVIVAADAQRRGVATAMLEHLIEIAERAGCYKVQLHSGKQRTDAHLLYRRLRFAAVAEGFKRYFDNTTRLWPGPA
jgi:ribosomal protein S18 acetylase RimI-like enzyme